MPWTADPPYGNEPPRSKLRGIESPACEGFGISSPPNVYIGGPDSDSSGFPLKTCGNDGLRLGDLFHAARRGMNPQRFKTHHEQGLTYIIELPIPGSRYTVASG